MRLIMGDDDSKKLERKKRYEEAPRVAEAMWKPAPAEVNAQNALWEPVLRAMKARQEQIERARKEDAEFERTLLEKLENTEADPSAEPAADVQKRKPKVTSQKKPVKPGRYDASDRSHFPAMEKFIATDESIEAAARYLGGKLKGLGTSNNKSRRLARLYRRERGK
jgi:hypothetical protein